MSILSSPQIKLPDRNYTIDPTILPNDDLKTPHTLDRAFECIAEICSAFQYEHFLIATVPSFRDQLKSENIMLTNLPAYLSNDFVKLEQSGEWRVLHGIESTVAPFCWHKKHGLMLENVTTEQNELSAADKFFVEQLKTATVHCVQAPTRLHNRAFIAAFSPQSDKTKIPAEFVLAFLRTFDRIEHLLNGRTQSIGENLTNRELECLRWASVGKTSAEIAVITGLSEHTVNHYLNFCCKKLDCLNRTQAVAKVLRSGIIT